MGTAFIVTTWLGYVNSCINPLSTQSSIRSSGKLSSGYWGLDTSNHNGHPLVQIVCEKRMTNFIIQDKVCRGYIHGFAVFSSCLAVNYFHYFYHRNKIGGFYFAKK